MMNQVKKFVLITLAVFTVCGGAFTARAAGTMNDSLLIVPARYTIVQFAFDIVALRGTALVSYDKDVDNSAVLYRWNWVASEWQSISTDELAACSFMKTEPRRIYLLGLDRDLPAGLENLFAGKKNLVRIKTLNIVQVVNALNKDMKFTPAEWEALARRHNFKIKDWNYERRRWGRYGPPKNRRIEAVGPQKQPAVEAAKDSRAMEMPETVSVKTEKPKTENTVEVKKVQADPFDEMERELKRLTNSQQPRDVKVITIKDPEARPLNTGEKPPELDKSDLVPLDLPPESDFNAGAGKGEQSIAPEDK